MDRSAELNPGSSCFKKRNEEQSPLFIGHRGSRSVFVFGSLQKVNGRPSSIPVCT